MKYFGTYEHVLLAGGRVADQLARMAARIGLAITVVPDPQI